MIAETLPDVQVTVAVPGVRPAISVAVAVPFSSTVVVAKLFLLFEKTARFVVNVAAVPITTAVPFLSFSVAVMMDELIPSAIIDEFDTERVILAVGPGITLTNFNLAITVNPPAEHVTVTSSLGEVPANRTTSEVPVASVTV